MSASECRRKIGGPALSAQSLSQSQTAVKRNGTDFRGLACYIEGVVYHKVLSDYVKGCIIDTPEVFFRCKSEELHYKARMPIAVLGSSLLPPRLFGNACECLEWSDQDHLTIIRSDL